MFEALIRFALKSRGLVLLVLAFVSASGVWAGLNLPIDAVPDVSPQQVTVLTDAPALGPEEVEQFITIPLENAMNGIPTIREMRSISQQGLSVVYVNFEEDTDIYWARAQISERLDQVRDEIPEGFGQPTMGPVTTGLGEIFQFEVRNARGAVDPKSLMELRTILDWEVVLPLKSVPGIIEVNSFGGELKTYRAEIDPDRLLARDIPINQVFDALRRNNSNAGGGYLQRNGEIRIVRGEGLARTTEDMDRIVLDTSEDGTPIFVKDVGRSVLAPMIRKGAVTRDGQGECVMAIAYMLLGENARVVVDRVEEKLDEIRERLEPMSVEVDVFYNRKVLIEKTIHTVGKNLLEGGVLVVVILVVMLGNLRAALIVASTIPLTMLFAGNLMYYYGIAGSLLSLGAIDFGLVVDSSVIVIENVVRRLSHADERTSRAEAVMQAVREVRTPVLFGVGIITMVNLPILALENVEGKMFKPMALTLIFALSGSLLLSFTVVPVLASYLLKKGEQEADTFPVRLAKRAYAPVLPWILGHPWAVVLASVVALASCVPPALSLGGQFIPQLDEGDIVIIMARPPSTSLDEGIQQTTRFERALFERFPTEIESVVSRTGSPEIGLDPAPLNRSDCFIFLTPYEGWPDGKTKQDLIRDIEVIARDVMPGTRLNFTQPIELRFNEMISGVRGDLGIALYGPDLGVLERKGHEIAEVLRTVRGAADVKMQPIAGLPYLRVIVDRDKIARYGINVSEVLDAVQAIGGATVGQVVVDQRRFAMQARYRAEDRGNLDAIGDLKIADPLGRMILLSDLAEIRAEDGVFEIRRSDRERRALIQANVRGRDLAGMVRDAQAAIRERVELPQGYRLDYGGTFENLQSATRRLTIVLPISLVMIFLLLYGTFGSWKLGLLIFLSLPFAAIGGVWALYLRGLDFSISAGVGFIALAGVSVLDGLVLVSAIRDRLIHQGEAIPHAVRESALERLRPILMTGLVASIGFVPMAFNTGTGAEVQRPLASVVIGGILTSTLMKLILLPAIYAWFDPGPVASGEEAGLDGAETQGAPPSEDEEERSADPNPED